MFSWRTTHPVALKSIAKVPNQKITRRPKCFFFLLPLPFLLQTDQFNLRNSFTMVFAQNSSIFHWAVHQPFAFFKVWSHTRRFEPLLKNYSFLYDAVFSSSVRMSTNDLAKDHLAVTGAVRELLPSREASTRPLWMLASASKGCARWRTLWGCPTGLSAKQSAKWRRELWDSSKYWTMEVPAPAYKAYWTWN